MSNSTYPFSMTLFGHKERLTWLVGAHDRVTNVVAYAEEQAAKHQFAAQDARYLQGLMVELINHHKAEIDRLEQPEGEPQDGDHADSHVLPET